MSTKESKDLITIGISFIATCHNRSRNELILSRVILDQMLVNSRNDDPDLEALELLGQIIGVYILQKGPKQ